MDAFTEHISYLENQVTEAQSKTSQKGKCTSYFCNYNYMYNYDCGLMIVKYE